MTLTCVLVANRGEIAVRIFRTAQRLGMRTVAVYSEADVEALHVHCADVALPIGGAPAAESYLCGERIIEAALAAGADCIHPGYGFLSENADFAEACAAAGLTFIGPPPAAIRSMGLKDRAKALMEKAGVPVVPGYHGAEQDEGFLLARAREIGFPVLLKAVAGGGGKGMRRVDGEAEFAAGFAGARREALASFGNGDLLVETFVRDPRHIEVQVFADRHGQVVHLFERDCSLQRRHQKVIEEAPAPGLGDEMRTALGAAAVEAARAVGYVGAGTVEFIAEGGPRGPSGRFWFMEMNTRLQVEHPVTEAITGLDLVEWQFRVASGLPLPYAQGEITAFGHAVEARVYAEDPDAAFLPSTGPVIALRLPEGDGIRVDAGVAEGGLVTPYYDPMIAKVIAQAPTREEALDRLAKALGDMRVVGPKTNLAFLQALCLAQDFRDGHFDTSFIARHTASLGLGPKPPDPGAVRLGALALMEEAFTSADRSAWGTFDGFQIGAQRRHGVRLTADGQDVEVELCFDATVGVHFGGGATSLADLDAAQADRRVARVPSGVLVLQDGRQTLVQPYKATVRAGGDNGIGEELLQAPLHGRIVRLAVKPGDRVEAGQVIAVVEAMKMEHSLIATRAGRILEVTSSEGAQVVQGALIARIGETGDIP